jgi:predicted O-methyltransferase YrrM
LNISNEIIIRELANVFTAGCDRAIVGRLAQPGDTFLDTHQTYNWYFAIGATYEPKRIMEIGVRYGYSLLAMAKGARMRDPEAAVMADGIDNEADGVASNQIAHDGILLEVGIEPWIIQKSSTEVLRAPFMPAIDSKFDIVHVDGDHSPEGVETELTLALRLVRKGGIILVDDMDTPHIAAAVKRRFGRWIEFPTIHRLALIEDF